MVVDEDPMSLRGREEARHHGGAAVSLWWFGCPKLGVENSWWCGLKMMIYL
jgi:hypothetical protein